MHIQWDAGIGILLLHVEQKIEKKQVIDPKILKNPMHGVQQQIFLYRGIPNQDKNVDIEEFVIGYR